MPSMLVAHRHGAALVVVAAALLPLVIGGCTTTTTNTATGEVRSSADAPSPDNEKRARVRLELAISYFERGQRDTALEEVKQALAVSPNLGAAYNLRGLIYASIGELRQAEESFQRAQQLDPRDAETMHNYGWFLCQQGRYPQAHERFEAAMGVPTYREVPRTLLAQGVCYGREKRWEKAEEALTRAYSVDAGNPVIGYNLSDVLYRRGEFERARFFIRRINQTNEYSNAQTLWLAMRIENRIGNQSAVTTIGQQLRDRFPQAPETAAYDRGRFDD
jgi:type IV pilus assembly protein PilF